MPLIPRAVTAIDDRDLSSVTYNGTWVIGGTEHEHDGTVSSSRIAGDSFTVRFIGTSIIVYGTYDASSYGVITSYSIDNGPAENHSHISSGLDTYQQEFWRAENLTNTEHSLLVTMENVNEEYEGGEGTVWFDYFNVEGTKVSQSLSSSASGTSSTSSDPASTSPSSSSSRTNHVGAIAGGVVGGLVAILAFVAFLLVWSKKRKNRHHHDFSIDEPSPNNASEIPQMSNLPPGASIPTPFLDVMTTSPPCTSSGPGSRKQPSSTRYPAASSISSNTGYTSSHSASGSTNNLMSQAPAAVIESKRARRSTSQSRPQPETIQHVDSGVRGTVELPPVYTAT